MDGKTFAKLSKDCKLLDKKLTATDIDLIFAKIKDKTERKITYAQFEAGLKLCAEKKGCDMDAVVAAVCGAGGPAFSGTKAEAVKYHDDKSQYTGVHKEGGPTTVDSIHPVASFGGAPEEEKKTAAPKKGTVATTKTNPAGSVEEVFTAFAAGKEMDGKTFAKWSKDCKVLDKACTATDIDLCFAKVKDKAARKINFAQFDKALHEIATKKKIDYAVLCEHVKAHGGPSFTGTKAEAVKYHDDKSQYTGVHAKGGPSTVDKDKISDISQTCDRSAADVRGTKK
jgi:hypothetical protein